MSEQLEKDFSFANPEQVKAYIEKRKVIEENYKILLDAHQNEAAYLELTANMAENELRNRMATLKLIELEARLKQGPESETKRELKK